MLQVSELGRPCLSLPWMVGVASKEVDGLTPCRLVIVLLHALGVCHKLWKDILFLLSFLLFCTVFNEIVKSV